MARLIALEGIGEMYAVAFARAGVSTVAQLLDASAGTLGDILKPDEWAGFDSWLASDAPFRVK